MKLDELVRGVSYLFWGRRVSYVGPVGANGAHVQFEDTREFFVAPPEELVPLRQEHHGVHRVASRFDRMVEPPREVFSFGVPTVDPFAYPKAVVGVLEGGTYSLFLREGSERRPLGGSFPTEGALREEAQRNVDALGTVHMEKLESVPFLLLSQEMEGIESFARILSIRIFGEPFDGKGKVRMVSDWLYVQSDAWEGLPEAQRTLIGAYLLGFKVGFGVGKDDEYHEGVTDPDEAFSSLL